MIVYNFHGELNIRVSPVDVLEKSKCCVPIME